MGKTGQKNLSHSFYRVSRSFCNSDTWNSCNWTYKTLPGHVKEALYAVLQQFDFATSFMWDMKSRMLTTHAQVTQKDYASTWVPRPRPRPHQTSYQDNFVIVYVWFCPNEKVWIKFKNRETEKKFLKNLPVFQRVPTQTQCNFKHSRKKIVEEWKVLW